MKNESMMPENAVEGQTYPVSKQENLEGTLVTAAKDAAFNQATYTVEVKIPGQEETISIDQDKAREILGDEDYERIKDGAA